PRDQRQPRLSHRQHRRGFLRIPHQRPHAATARQQLAHHVPPHKPARPRHRDRQSLSHHHLRVRAPGSRTTPAHRDGRPSVGYRARSIKPTFIPSHPHSQFVIHHSPFQCLLLSTTSPSPIAPTAPSCATSPSPSPSA